MLNFFTTKHSNTATPIIPIIPSSLKAWLKKQPAPFKNWVENSQFTAKSGSFCLVPTSDGKIESILLGIEDKNDFWACGDLPQHLKNETFYFAIDTEKNDLVNNIVWNTEELQRFFIAWGLGSYKFSHYKKHDDKSFFASKTNAKLFVPKSCDYAYLENVVNATFLTRDLINYPAEDLGPVELAKVALDIAKTHHAKCHIIAGDNLLKENYRLIHAVGRASNRPPHFVEFTWGDPRHPRLALVGKGVCFDSGGLHLKPEQHMEGMQQDMAGAANALALAQMIMTAKLPVYLHVALPIVDNVISANAFKPGDIITSRQGKTVEIISTDAEGRLLLVDALHRVAEEKPKLILDFASLTGSSTVALGTEIASMFTEDNALAAAISAATVKEKEYVWHMPLHKNYRHMLDSEIADIRNLSGTRYGGAITAALFLRDFVPDNIPWIHFDLHSCNVKAQPGRPKGGEALALKGLFAYIKEHFAK